MLIIVLIFAIVIGVVILVRGSFSAKSQETVTIKILINHMQVLGLFKKGNI